MKKTLIFPSLSGAALVLLAGGLDARADYPAAVLADQPAGYYRFSETGFTTVPYPIATNLGAVGPAGNGVDATSNPEPGITKGVAGALNDPANTAFQFPGAALNRVRVPYQPEWNINGPFTVEFWAKPSTTVFSCPASSVDFNQSPRYGWLFYQSDTDLNFGNGWLFRIYKEGGGTATAAVNANVANAWWHIVGVYDGANVILYTNGVRAVTAPVNGTYVPNTKDTVPLTFGARSDYPLNVLWEYPGALDEPAFYTSALSDQDIAAHYAAAATNAAGYAGQILAHDPAGYWRFNELYPPRPVAQNSGGAGASLDAAYHYFSTTAPDLQAPTFGGFAPDNTVLELAGNGYVQTAPANLNANTVTFECWLKRDGDQPEYAGVIFHRNGTDTSGLDFKSTSNQLGYHWNDASTTWSWDSGLVPPDGVWTYVALAVSPSQAVMYMYDGTTWSAATNAVSHPVQAFAGPVRIGWDANERYFKGRIDEVAIYNRTLTAGQLRSHALAGLGDANPPVLVTDPPTLAPADAIYASESFVLTAEAYGTPPLTYQWLKDGALLEGATSSSYAKSGATGQDSGNYDVVVTNPHGSVTSALPAVVTIFDQPADIITDLRLWLRFNETCRLYASDESGNGRDGALAGFPDDDTQWVEGRQGGALRLNPEGHTGERAFLWDEDGWLDFSTLLEFTFAAWVKAAPAQAEGAGILAKGFGAGGEQYALDVNTGKYRFYVRSASGDAAVLQSSVAPNNDWQYIVAVFSTPLNRMKLYVNGAEVASRTPPADLLSTTHEVSLGSRQSGSGDYDMNFNGLLDDVCLYARALSPGDITALYSQTPAIPPNIVQAPQAQSMYEGGSASFNVIASGSAPLAYQWFFNNAKLPGQTNATLTIARVSAADLGDYSVTVTNAAGGDSSAPVALTAITPAPGSYEALVLADQPEAYWRLNETNGPVIADAMGRHPGTTRAHGHADSGESFDMAQPGVLAGNPDTCIQFHRERNTQINVPYSPSLNTTNFTIECWANISGMAPDNYYAVLSSRDINEGVRGYLFYAATDNLWEFWLGKNTGFSYAHGPAPEPGAWTHLVGTYDGQFASIYVNGTLAETIILPLLPNVRLPLLIGAGGNENGGDYWFDGAIDEVAYYPNVLSPERIGEHYAIGVHGPNVVIRRAGEQIELLWQTGVLEEADDLAGPWKTVAGAAAPAYQVKPEAARKFYRLKF